MSDIWDNVVSGLVADVHVMIGELRENEFFTSMGSEIERAFAATLIGGGHISGQAWHWGVPTSPRKEFAFIAPQVQVGEYRVDFVIGRCSDFDKPLRCIVVECDGHQFHQKTKEQAARDRTRDRFLSTKYGRVIRFTGSEIYRDPSRCAVEAVQVLVSAMGDE
jgi:very-short-patch-repair endonuclease